MAEAYDLIPAEKACDVFNVQFDLYTPRAHFMILPCNPKERYDKLSEEDQLKVIKLAMSMVSEYNLQKSAILSLHFGSWLSTPSKFHAHICVDVEDYIQIVRNNEEIISKHLPPLERRNKWKKGKNLKDYDKNVRGYPFQTYFEKEVGAIEEHCQKPSGASKITCLPPFFIHKSEPRVGYVVERSDEPEDHKFKALKEMIEYADTKNLTTVKAEGENNGCHVCLVLDEKSHGKSILVNLP